MATIKNEKLILIKKYYKEGYSVKDIAAKLNVSIDSTYYFFRKHNIKRRNRTEARNLAYDRQSATFSLKKNLSVYEKELKVAGIMLYWGEGSKWTGEKIIDFANSDLGIIKVFLKFLRVICGVKESKLRVYLYCYSNQEPSKLIEYWSKEINISKKQFTKPYVRKDFNNKKTGKMKHGLIHIRYADRKLLDQMRIWIGEYNQKLS
jgi:transposase-like protein